MPALKVTQAAPIQLKAARKPRRVCAALAGALGAGAGLGGSGGVAGFGAAATAEGTAGGLGFGSDMRRYISASGITIIGRVRGRRPLVDFLVAGSGMSTVEFGGGHFRLIRHQ